MKLRHACSIAIVSVAIAQVSAAYPTDGFDRTGIRRLKGTLAARQLKPGAMLGVDDIRLNLKDSRPKADIGDQDPRLKAAIDSIFEPRDPSYAVAVIDITDPDHIAWAGRRETFTQYPGSVGKMLCAVAFFDGLAKAFPDTKIREQKLKESMITAGPWGAGDSHKVPVYDPEWGGNHVRAVQADDVFAMSEWLDHALSASANSAGAILWREAMLIHELGDQWPGTDEQREKVLSRPGPELYALSQSIINEPLTKADLDLAGLKQGTFWTRYGQKKVPGTSSYASPRELARLLLRIEEGRIVDEWSSLELKRYMYMTRKRYRYAYAPELDDAAIFFKSGSLYECRSEPGFRCGKYMGNVKNFMNSICIIESPARPTEGVVTKRYIVAMMSNVLRVNSAWDHARVGAAIEEAVRTRQATTVQDAGSDAAKTEAGKGD
jgi:hypothetical protein